MNAYDLAEIVDKWAYSESAEYLTDAANMLRQQADRIAELEKDLALKTRDRDVFCDFTLAYEKRIEELEKLEQDFIRVIKQTNPNKPQTKPLSNDEILEMTIWNKNLYELYVEMDKEDMIAFARAIEERHGIK